MLLTDEVRYPKCAVELCYCIASEFRLKMIVLKSIHDFINYLTIFIKIEDNNKGIKTNITHKKTINNFVSF